MQHVGVSAAGRILDLHQGDSACQLHLFVKSFIFSQVRYADTCTAVGYQAVLCKKQGQCAGRPARVGVVNSLRRRRIFGLNRSTLFAILTHQVSVQVRRRRWPYAAAAALLLFTLLIPGRMIALPDPDILNLALSKSHGGNVGLRRH